MTITVRSHPLCADQMGFPCLSRPGRFAIRIDVQHDPGYFFPIRPYNAWLLTDDGVPPVEERAGRPAGGLIARRQ
jgi:hypothetical protein